MEEKVKKGFGRISANIRQKGLGIFSHNAGRKRGYVYILQRRNWRIFSRESEKVFWAHFSQNVPGKGGG